MPRTRATIDKGLLTTETHLGATVYTVSWSLGESPGNVEVMRIEGSGTRTIIYLPPDLLLRFVDTLRAHQALVALTGG